MIEADAPSTEGMVAVWCPPHRGLSWSHYRRSCATQRGRKAKAALSNRGGVEQRGKQHTHYKGRDALKHNSEPGHLGSCLGSCMGYRGGAMQEFSVVRAVASRNSLYQTLAINVAVRGVVEGEMWLYPVPIGIGPGRGGGACNRELRRILVPRTSVNKGKKFRGIKALRLVTALLSEKYPPIGPEPTELRRHGVLGSSGLAPKIVQLG